MRIGLTGPIGCGKSTVARWLAELGAVPMDADALAREVVEPGQPALNAVVERFGATLLTREGRLDRAALGRIVFADAAALADLEAIVHPAVRPRIEAAVAAAEKARAPAVVVEAIKLVEAGYAAACDEVWLVTCEPLDQRRRLRARGADPDDVARRIEAQGSIEDRVGAVATRIIVTTGQPDETRARVIDAYRAAIGPAARIDETDRPRGRSVREPG